MQKLLKPFLYVKTKTGYSVFTIVVVALFSAWLVYEATKAEVVVAEDGEIHVVKTRLNTVGELLDDLGIEVSANDELSHDANTKIIDGMEINYYTAYNVVVVVDGEIEEYITTANTVGDFFEEKNFYISPYDEVSHSAIEVINSDIQINIARAFPVTVVDGKEEIEVWTTGGTVAHVLNENNITYSTLDKIDPSLETELTDDATIEVVRVEKEVVEVEEQIPYKTEERKDASLYSGNKKTISEGKEGKVLKTFEVVYENGEEVARELVAEEIIENATNKVVAVGTKKRNTVQRAEVGKEYTMVATAYGPDCKGCRGITAYGINIKNGPLPKVVAVDPRVIPLGSKVWVEGYGEAIAGDTGGAIKGNRVDVLVKSEAYAAKNWGRRTVKVKVLQLAK